MITLHPEYIIDVNETKKSVVLPYKEWLLLISNIKDIENISTNEKEKLSLEKGIIDADNGKLNSHAEVRKVYEKWL